MTISKLITNGRRYPKAVGLPTIKKFVGVKFPKPVCIPTIKEFVRVARGKEELHPTRLYMKTKSEAQTSKSSKSAGSSIHGPNSSPVQQHHAAAESEDVVVIKSQPASPVKPEPHHTLANPNTFNDWSPLDDGIEVVLPNGSDKAPSREEIDAYIFSILNGPIAKRRLPVFENNLRGASSSLMEGKFYFIFIGSLV